MKQDVDGVIEDEIGYLVARPHWRRGFASEAAAGVRDLAFGAMGKARVVSMIRPENLPSRGVAAKLGMRVERQLPWRGFVHMVHALHCAGAPPQ